MAYILYIEMICPKPYGHYRSGNEAVTSLEAPCSSDIAWVSVALQATSCRRCGPSRAFEACKRLDRTWDNASTSQAGAGIRAFRCSRACFWP